MGKAGLSSFLRQLTRGMASETLNERSDRQLVERLLANPDEAAFEALVRRHGSMVYRVCWKILRRTEDAEDAFQATFFLLARKLRSLKRHDSLASWLHGVALRVSLNARRQLGRQRRHEEHAPAVASSSPDELPWGEVQTILELELASLDEKHKLPLTLCYLEGRSQEEAAKHLGWSRSTLVRRLDEAREMLGQRLTRKGLVWPAVLSGLLLSDCLASATLPAKLIGSTVDAVSPVLLGGMATNLKASSTTLAEGVMKSMARRKLMTIGTILILGGALGLGAGEMFSLGLATGPALAAAQPPSPYPNAEPLKSPTDVPARDSKPVVIREDAQVGHVTWSADSKRVAAITTTFQLEEITDGGDNPSKVLFRHTALKLWNAATGKLEKALVQEKETDLQALAFSPDNKLLAIMGRTGLKIITKLVEKLPEDRPKKFVKILDTANWEVKQELTDDDLQGVLDAIVFSPDSKTLALGGGSPLADKGSVVKLWDLERKKMTTAAKFAEPPRANIANPRIGERPPEWWAVQSLAFSSDGKTLAAGEFGVGGKRARIRLYDPKSGEPKQTWEIREPKGMVGVAFAADNKSLVSACGAVKFWNVETGKEQKTLDTKGTETFDIAVSSDGRHLATSGVRTVGDKSIYEARVWDVAGNLLRIVSWPDASMWASSITFSRDGRSLAIGSQTSADVRIKGSENVKGELQIIPLGR